MDCSYIKILEFSRECTLVIFINFAFMWAGDHYIHVYWSDVPLDTSPILAYCPGPILPVDHTKVVIEGKGKEKARALVPAEFIINGKSAGSGKPHPPSLSQIESLSLSLSLSLISFLYFQERLECC